MNNSAHNPSSNSVIFFEGHKMRLGIVILTLLFGILSCKASESESPTKKGSSNDNSKAVNSKVDDVQSSQSSAGSIPQCEDLKVIEQNDCDCDGSLPKGGVYPTRTLAKSFRASLSSSLSYFKPICACLWSEHVGDGPALMLHRKSGKNVSVGETIQINICDSKNLGKTLPIRSPKQLSSEFNPKLLCQKGIFGASGLSASDSDIKDNNGVAQFDGPSLKSIKKSKEVSLCQDTKGLQAKRRLSYHSVHRSKLTRVLYRPDITRERHIQRTFLHPILHYQKQFESSIVRGFSLIGQNNFNTAWTPAVYLIPPTSTGDFVALACCHVAAG